MKRNVDVPDPVGTTPQQIADELDRIGRKLLGMSYDFRRIGLGGVEQLRGISDSLCGIAARITEPQPNRFGQALAAIHAARSPEEQTELDREAEDEADSEPDPPRNGLVELAAEPDRRTKTDRRTDAAVKANETRKRENAERATWTWVFADTFADPLPGERMWLIYDAEGVERHANISAADLTAAEERAARLLPRLKGRKIVPREEVFGPFPHDPSEDEPDDDDDYEGDPGQAKYEQMFVESRPPDPKPEPADDAETKRQRKREADRKYAAKRKAARDLAKALGNPVESTGAPVGTIAREPVIDRPTEPAKSLAATEPADDIFIAWSGRNPLYGVRAKSLMDAVVWVRNNHPANAKIDVKVDEGIFTARKLSLQADLKANPSEFVTASVRAWEAYDLRESPPVRLGEVTGANSTRAVMAAEAAWPDVPKRMIEIREVVRSNGRRKRSEVGT